MTEEQEEIIEFLVALLGILNQRPPFHARFKLNRATNGLPVLDLEAGDGRSMQASGNLVNTRLRIDLFFSRTAADEALVGLMDEFHP